MTQRLMKSFSPLVQICPSLAIPRRATLSKLPQLLYL